MKRNWRGREGRNERGKQREREREGRTEREKARGRKWRKKEEEKQEDEEKRGRKGKRRKLFNESGIHSSSYGAPSLLSFLFSLFFLSLSLLPNSSHIYSLPFFRYPPVLSEHNISTPAISSTAVTRVMITFCLASACAPSAMVTDRTVIMATGTAATVSTSTNLIFSNTSPSWYTARSTMSTVAPRMITRAIRKSPI